MPLNRGDFAYLVELFQDTAEWVRKDPCDEECGYFEVKGKSRPWLIWRCASENNRVWYYAFKISTKQGDKRTCYHIGKLPGRTKPSFAYVPAVRISEKLRDEQRLTAIGQIEREGLDAVITKARRFAMEVPATSRLKGESSSPDS